MAQVNKVPQIAVINDLSGYGRCSLTVAIPVLSAMGYQTCPLPTSLLSTHTGYEGAYICDFTDDMGAYLSHWEQLGLRFDAVYTGFLGNEAQVELLLPFVQHCKAQGALSVVDPAMADHGQLYSSCTSSLVGEMRRLVAMADVTTPNLTEACLLTDTVYHEVVGLDEKVDCKRLHDIGKSLLSLGCGAAVVTGVHATEKELENWVFERGCEPRIVRTSRVPQNFAGTGDVFSSVLCGELLRGLPLVTAVERTAAFVQMVTSYTASLGTNAQDGIAFEPFLYQLHKKEGNS